MAAEWQVKRGSMGSTRDPQQPGLLRGVALALIIGAGALSQAAIAQSIHKYVWPDGRIIYSNEPVPGARRIGTVDVPPAPGRQAVQAARERSTDADRRSQQQFGGQDLARQRVEDAIVELERARQALARPSSLQPNGGVADGGGGLPEGYRYRVRPRSESRAR